MMNFELIKTFFKIGMFTLGGGYAMIPLIEEEVVRRHGWVTREEMVDLIAIAQSCPGVFAINISIFIGYRQNKIRGAVASAVGTALPSFLVILLVAVFFQQFKDNRYVEAVFRGIRPSVVALIAVPTLNLARQARLSRWTLWIPVVSAMLIWVMGVNPIWIIIAAGVGGFIWGRIEGLKN